MIKGGLIDKLWKLSNLVMKAYSCIVLLALGEF